MKKSIFVAVLLLLSLPLWAQNSKVKAGIAAYEQEDYEKAVTEFDAALKKVKKLKSGYLPQAYFYRGKAQLGILKKAAMAGDMEKMESVDLLTAKDDFQHAIAHDDGNWGEKAKEELDKLRLNFVQLGLTYLNSKIYEEAQAYLSAAAEIEDEYVVNDLLAQIQMDNGEYKKAGELFDKSITLFQTNKPERPDLLMAYAFYRRAMIYSYYSGEYFPMDELYEPTKEDVENAFATLKDGQRVLEEEWSRAEAIKATIEPERWTQWSRKYATAKDDLKRFELDLYLKFPDKAKEALGKFEEAVKAEPNNYILRVAYASILEKTDQEKAIYTYKKAIEIDKNKEVAYFNLGSMYINTAAEAQEKANVETDAQKAKKHTWEMKLNMTKAKPLFEKVLELSPTSLATVRALKLITTQLELTEEFKKYKALEAELSGY